MNILLWIVVSILPVILLGMYVYNADKNKEPLNLLTQLFLSGVVAAILTLIISQFTSKIFPILGRNYTELNLIQLAFYVFIGISLIEEFFKWIFLYNISYNDKAFDELFDTIVYGVFVALGFACFENLMYVYQHGIEIGLLRAISAVPGHACDGVFMGYYLGLAKLCAINGKNNLKIKNLIYSLLVPIIMHGIYDYCIFSGNVTLTMVFLVYVIYMYIIASSKINEIAKCNTKMKYGEGFCKICGTLLEGNECLKCNKINIMINNVENKTTE